ncbi:adenylate/guanylate cyclase domain-containing protein [Nocardioides jiangxiensis]|uniref:Adenylate/guanylate cyclase domain-containing protein n=1 Tax=Nocardioides jiangxiensis TaxID=3064524 RepID=A0ABT9B2N0_9ACTN|nr:adenylate/guanylate cyclase domain-containing protein [Nocardioides sp. WY-20]MDO7869105.1 adenylate/guanylate cyclase domain-containing protein [Nocardioides sp. WY-20]
MRAEVRQRFLALSLTSQARLLTSLTLVSINLMGVLLVAALALFVIPLPVDIDADWIAFNAVIIVSLAWPVAVFGHWWAFRQVEPVVSWLEARRSPTDDEKLALLAVPRTAFAFHARGWMLGVVTFMLLNAWRLGWNGAWSVGQIVLIAGICASALAYLVAERLIRPLASVALRNGVPERARLRTVVTRTMFAWALGTAAPVVGLVMVGSRLLTDDTNVTVNQIARTMIVIALIALVVGGLMILLAGRATSDPVRQLRLGLAQLERGDLDVHLPIYDGTDIGVLQAGFNDMAAGLRERERMRDLFGRHVGDDVARAALEGGVRLRGEARYVGVLFTDVIGSTTLATEREPGEVVMLLNRFFEIVIDVVHQHDGWINKFEGDAALAVWGVPTEVEDLERKVLHAARELGRRLQDELPEVPAGIGVTAGEVVAGNVGVAERYEYTLIGDPVVEASRLSEVAKRFPGRVVANAALLDAAGPEAEAWVRKNPVRPRGRVAETVIAVTRD